MNISDFKDSAVKSAKIYYDYLDRNGRGTITTRVRRIEPHDGTFLLTLSTRLSQYSADNPGSLLFDFNGRRCSSFEVRPLEYDERSATLLVRPNKELLPEFSRLAPAGLTILFDLKFLVGRVGLWYESSGNRPTLPTTSSTPPIIYPSGVSVSPDQAAAIEGALSSPFSYVWGAPGTGKTRVVLASCVLSHLMADPDRTVLLLAPTNNALDQMLFGILPALEDAGLSHNLVLRLGTATAPFAKKYPSVCEWHQIDKQLDSIRAQLNRIEQAIQLRPFLSLFDRAQEQLPILIQQVDLSLSLRKQLREQADAVRQCSINTQAKDTVLRSDLEQLLAQERAQKLQIDRTSALTRFFFARRHARRISAHEQTIELLREKTAQREQLAALLAEYERQCSELFQQAEQQNVHIAASFSEMFSLTEFCPTLLSSIKTLRLSWASGQSMLADAIETERQRISQASAACAPYTDMSDEELRAKHAEMLGRCTDLENDSTENRKASARVLAATIDKFLTLHFSPDSFFPFHVFLDEAAYCSLVKGAAPLSLGVPYTLLGDHMQLPPICEMNDGDFDSPERMSMCLWAQSAVHAEHIFTHSLPDLCSAYLHNLPPMFTSLKKYDLSVTYRFSSSLADILADHVYERPLFSLSSSGTQLLVLDAPHRPEHKDSHRRRISPEEANAIKQYLPSLHSEDYVVLAPYRNQVSHLSKTLPHLHRDGRILTVHASQGREWDTVFLCVTDTYNAFFVDSHNQASRGLQVVNTAVSRAKKRLIIVCDRDFWRDHPEQLVGALVNASQPIT